MAALLARLAIAFEEPPSVPAVADAPTAAINVSVAAVIATTTSRNSPSDPLIRAGYASDYQVVKLAGHVITPKTHFS